MRLILDLALICAVTAPILWLIGLARWRRLRRDAERFRKGGGLP